MAIITDEMISSTIVRKDMLPLSFLKKSAYTGSKRKLNYKLEKTEIELQAPTPEDTSEKTEAASKAEPEQNTEAAPVKKTVLRIYWWTGPFSFDNTPPEEITSHDVEFSDAGIDEAISYLNEVLVQNSGSST